MEYSELTERIIGCAYSVYNRMGFGFLESVYEKCMIIELRKAGLNAESQKPITVYYENEIVGEFVADIIVNDVKQEVWEFNSEHWSFLGRLIPTKCERAIGRIWGWHRITYGIKRAIKNVNNHKVY